MGLDNGIAVRRNEAFERHYDYFKRFDEEWCKRGNYDPDICYWRKCYNIRDEIFSTRLPVHDNDRSDNLTSDDIDTCIEILASFTKESWYDGAGSIWSWEEILPCLKEQTSVLCELSDLMREDPAIEVYFYDSY